MADIVQKEKEVLRAIAKPIEDFSSEELKSTIHSMAEAMFEEPDGIGIAAPQINISKQIFLVASDVLSSEELDKRIEMNKKNPNRTKKITPKDYMVFINPVFKKLSQKKSKDLEGCLSVRGFYGEVSRPEKVSIEYYDENGNKKTRGASGLFARVLQHEMDHLNGMLFIDKAKNIEKVEALIKKREK